MVLSGWRPGAEGVGPTAFGHAEQIDVDADLVGSEHKVKLGSVGCAWIRTAGTDGNSQVGVTACREHHAV